MVHPLRFNPWRALLAMTRSWLVSGGVAKKTPSAPARPRTALEETDGHYIQFSGDGLMALYGLESGVTIGSRRALRGAAVASFRVQDSSISPYPNTDAYHRRPSRRGANPKKRDIIVSAHTGPAGSGRR